MATKPLIIEVWVNSWDWEEDSNYVPTKPHRFICLPCFLQGLVKPVTSPRFLCVRHGAQFREWRKKRGLPPVNGPSERKRGEIGIMRRQQVVSVLREGPATATEIAGALGMKDDAVKHYLYRLRDERQVVNVGPGKRQQSGGNGSRKCVWQLTGER